MLLHCLSNTTRPSRAHTFCVHTANSPERVEQIIKVEIKIDSTSTVEFLRVKDSLSLGLIICFAPADHEDEPNCTRLWPLYHARTWTWFEWWHGGLHIFTKNSKNSLSASLYLLIFCRLLISTEDQAPFSPRHRGPHTQIEALTFHDKFEIFSLRDAALCSRWTLYAQKQHNK